MLWRACRAILKKIKKSGFAGLLFQRICNHKLRASAPPHVSKDYHQNQNFQGPFWRRILADLSHFVSNFFFQPHPPAGNTAGTWFKRKGLLRKTQHSSSLARRAAPPVFTSKSLKKETGFAGKTLFFSTLLLHYVCYAFYSCRRRPKT